MAEFQRAIAKLKSEREALEADWNSLTRRLAKQGPMDGPDLDKLHKQLKETLSRLHQERLKAAPTVSPSPTLLPKLENPGHEKKAESIDRQLQTDSAQTKVSTPTGPVDVLHLAQTLFRAERYEEALAAFRKVDLKGRKPEERVPVQFLTAICLHKVGKTEESLTLLREAANSRGDERFAGYAQWQIESVRWQRTIDAKLEDIRQRRLATEKR